MDSVAISKSELASPNTKESARRDNPATANVAPNANKNYHTINDIQTVMSIYTMNGKGKPMPLPKEYQPPIMGYKG